jgi:hypothetical protein
MKTMKNNILLLFLLALVFSACEHEKLDTYSGQNEIYFQYAIASSTVDVVDSTVVHFGYDTPIKEDSLIRIKVKVMGDVVDFDRAVAFELETASSAQSGQDVELLLDSSYVKAGKTVGQVAIKIKNTANLDDKILNANLKLLSNEFFQTDFKSTSFSSVNATGKINSIKYRVLFDNANEKPNLWAYYDSRFTPYFGTYSKKKLDLICELINITREYFTYTRTETQTEAQAASAAFSAKWPTSIMLFSARTLNNYLSNYKRTHGEPLLEDDGTEMVPGPLGLNLF